MKLSTYKSLLTKKRTWLVASKGKCGYPDHVEYTIQLSQGQWQCYKTDGYKLDLVGIYPASKGLKSVLNLVWGGINMITRAYLEDLFEELLDQAEQIQIGTVEDERYAKSNSFHIYS